jgi:trehalose 6-phosphate synthase/phosphatase
MPRLIVVSNRLPFSLGKSLAKTARGGFSFRPSSGGLVTALGAWLEREKKERGLECIWVGWPGADVPVEKQPEIRERALRDHGSWPVFMSADEADKFYHGFCNKTLWPLFHYFTSYATYEAEQWESYVAANRRFAAELQGLLREGDRVWVQDYQLMLLPGMLREARPGLAVGFFLHIPFPSFEVFRLLPARWRGALLEGVLGADLIGFHTHDYCQYFLRSVYRTLGHDHHFGQIQIGDRVRKVDTFPIGIDAERFIASAESPAAAKLASEIRADLGESRKILFSVDRLDYSKGILHRLLGFGEFLDRNPEWREKVVFVLSVVPSREEVPQYRRMKKDLDEMVGRINGRHGNTGWMPIVYQYRSMPFAELTAFYRMADVALITPLRDGMNLVAKEYVACRTSLDGVLILSETTGAARDLGEAILVNPNHQGELAEALLEALRMPPAEQRRRMEPMRERLRRYDAAWWANSFLESLENLLETPHETFRARLLSPERIAAVRADFRAADKRLLLLDYDGTLVPFAPLPHLASPDPELKDLVRRLCADPRNIVVLISGRDRATLLEWFGDEALHLIAEHGAWVRPPAGEWGLLKPVEASWKETLLPLFRMYVGRLPGSLLEVKDYSLAWHYRLAEPELGLSRAKELVDDLTQYTANFDVQVLEGKKVVEIRNTGITKGAAAAMLLQAHEPGFILSIGDDQTDEDVFRALPPEAVTIRVGTLFSRARFSLADHGAVRKLLEELASEVRS